MEPRCHGHSKLLAVSIGIDAPFSRGPRETPLLQGPAGETLAYMLFHELGRALADGAYRCTPFPTDQALRERYGVSRTVTREALKMLEAKGMVGSRPKIGNFVLPLARWSLFDSDVLQWLAH